MHSIEIREQHGNLLIEINAQLVAARHMMEAATGLGPSKLAEAKAELLECANRLHGIAVRLGK